MSDTSAISASSQVKPTENIVIFNVYGHLNTGDAMLLETLIDVLREKRTTAKLSGIAFDVESETQWAPSLSWHERIGNATSRGITGRLRQAFSLLLLLVMALFRRSTGLARFLPESQRSAVEALAKADIAISCPGGYLEDSNNAYILNLVQILLACRHCRHVVLAPQSIGPIKSPLGHFLVKQVVRRSRHIFVREPASLEFLQQVLGPQEWRKYQKKVDLVGDLAFWFKQPPRNADDKEMKDEIQRLGIDTSRPILGLTLVNWNFPHTENPVQYREKYLDALSQFVQHVEAKGTHQIVIFNQVKDDLVISEELVARHPNVVLDTFEREAQLFCRLVGLCDVFIGTRFHSCIFALLENVPTIAVAYLPKTSGIMQDLGLDEYVLDINSVTGEALIQKFEATTQARNAVADRIAKSVSSYKAARSQFISYLDRAAR